MAGKVIWLVVACAVAAGVYTQRAAWQPQAEATTGIKLPFPPLDADAKAKAESKGGTAAKGGPPVKGGFPPAPVTAAIAAEIDMPIILSAPGAVEPLATVAVRPRVDGQITQVNFVEGEFVQAGQVLFQMDDRLVRAQIQQAEANIARDVANMKDAELILGRREQLLRQKYTSEASTDTQRASVENLKASIVAGKALLDAQKTQLDYLTVRAPISGRTGNITTKLGTTVRTAEPTAMVTINQTRPISITFGLPQGDIAAVRQALVTKAPAKVVIAGAKPIVRDATITFVDNQVDKQTGTISVKAVAPNADEALWPGQAVEVALTVEVRPKIIAVPVSAVLPAAEGMITWVIGEGNKVTPRVVVVDRIVDQLVFLQSGLKSGDRVVTDGQIRLAPGATVAVRETPPTKAPAVAQDVAPAVAPPPVSDNTPAKPDAAKASAKSSGRS